LSQVVAASAITVSALMFSLTVVALQLASQQFSPRLLREFTRDPVTRAVLAVLLGTFAFSVVVLRSTRSDGEAPAWAAFGVTVLALLSMCALLWFVAHIVRILRIDTMMRAVHENSRRAIELFYARREDPRPRAPGPELDRTEGAEVVCAERSGFVRKVHVAALVEAARQHGVVVRLLVRAGDHVIRHTPIAVFWDECHVTPQRGVPGPRRAPAGRSPEQLAAAVRRTVDLGYERTFEQDAAFGFRQLEDIAVKAMSPAINDPVTAAHAIGHMADLLVVIVGRWLGPTLHADEQGVGRAVVPDRDLAYYLDLACGQVRRSGAREPTIMVALLRMLRDVGLAARDDEQRRAIAAEADRVVAAAAETSAEPGRASVEELRARVELALRGRGVEAYLDGAGETRSL